MSELYGCTGWQMNFQSHKAVGDCRWLVGSAGYFISRTDSAVKPLHIWPYGRFRYPFRLLRAFRYNARARADFDT